MTRTPDRRPAAKRTASVLAGLLLLAAANGLVAQGIPTTQPQAPATQPEVPASQPDRKGRPPVSRPSPDRQFRALEQAYKVERAHGMDAWFAKDAVRLRLKLELDGEPTFDGTLLYDIHGGRIRLEGDDGTTMVFDGERVWIAPASRLEGQEGHVRYQALMWPYFLAVPFKLRDDGTRLREHGLIPLVNDEFCRSIRLEFLPGTGDSPEDRHVVCIDTQTGRLIALAYLSTYGSTFTAVAKDPSRAGSIVYHDFLAVDGVMLATRWTFHGWDAKLGPEGDERGHAELGEIAFVEIEDDAFAVPEGAVADAVPAGS